MTVQNRIATSSASIAPSLPIFVFAGAVQMGITLVVPCYNEERRLNLSAFMEFLRAEPMVKLVLVNDGSRDATLAVLEALRVHCPEQVTVIDLPQNRGKAEAVRAGLTFATERGDAVVGYWDADLATPFSALADFSNVLTRLPEVEVVFGSRRRMLGHRIERTLGRRMVSRLCNLMARTALAMPVADTQCGAKVFRNTEAFRRAIAAPFTAGWLFDVELMARIAAGMSSRRMGFYELPLLEWSEIAGSKISPRVIVQSGLRMLRLIAKLRLVPGGLTAGAMMNTRVAG